MELAYRRGCWAQGLGSSRPPGGSLRAPPPWTGTISLLGSGNNGGFQSLDSQPEKRNTKKNYIASLTFDPPVD